jgi:hypothetical protein
LAITTSGKPEEGVVERAQAVARQWSLPFIPRRKKEPLKPLLEQVAEALLVFERQGVTLWDAEGSTGFHEGLAHLRLQRLRQGQHDDVFLRVAGLRPGDALLDCTLGLGQDAMVAAFAVGPSGRVMGLEMSLALCVLVSEGLVDHPLGPDSCAVQVLHADAREYLRSLPSGAFDVVFLDPMFEKPKKSQPSFELLRRFAEHAPLTPETLQEARRVARRQVVVKGSRYSGDLSRLGLRPEPGSLHTSTVWGRVDGLGAG